MKEKRYEGVALDLDWIERVCPDGYQKRRKTPRFSHGDIRRKIHTPFTK